MSGPGRRRRSEHLPNYSRRVSDDAELRSVFSLRAGLRLGQRPGQILKDHLGSGQVLRVRGHDGRDGRGDPLRHDPRHPRRFREVHVVPVLEVRGDLAVIV